MGVTWSLSGWPGILRWTPEGEIRKEVPGPPDPMGRGEAPSSETVGWWKQSGMQAMPHPWAPSQNGWLFQVPSRLCPGAGRRPFKTVGCFTLSPMWVRSTPESASDASAVQAFTGEAVSHTLATVVHWVCGWTPWGGPRILRWTRARGCTSIGATLPEFRFFFCPWAHRTLANLFFQFFFVLATALEEQRMGSL